MIVAYALRYLWLSIPTSSSFTLPWAKDSHFCKTFNVTENVPTCPEAFYNDVVLQRTVPEGDESLPDVMSKGLSDVNWNVTFWLMIAWIFVSWMSKKLFVSVLISEVLANFQVGKSTLPFWSLF